MNIARVVVLGHVLVNIGETVDEQTVQVRLLRGRYRGPPSSASHGCRVMITLGDLQSLLRFRIPGSAGVADPGGNTHILDIALICTCRTCESPRMLG